MAVAAINTIITYAKISQYLAANDNSNKYLFQGRDLVPKLSRLIYIVRKQVENRYDNNPTDSSLDATANYLYALCGKYINQAKLVIGSGGTGTIVNPANLVISTILSRNLEFKIGDVGALMNPGDTTLTLTGYPFILNASIAITLDGVDLPIGASDRISFTPTYGLLTSSVTFNSPVAVPQLYSIRFLQYISI